MKVKFEIFYHYAYNNNICITKYKTGFIFKTQS